MFKLNHFVKPQDLAIEINSLEKYAFPKTIDTADQIIITLENSLLNTLQINFVKDKNIDLPEQIKWQINSLLDKAIENYYFDYQIYSQENESEIRGVCGFIEKERLSGLLEEIKKHNNNIALIESADKQFTLFKRTIPLWEKKELLYRSSRTAVLLTAVTMLVCFPALAILNSKFNTNELALQAKQKTLTELTNKYEQLIAQKTLKAQAKKAQERNKLLLHNLREITAKAPTSVFFQELVYQKENNSIVIVGFTDRGFSAINKYLKSLKQIKTLDSAALAKTANSNSTTSFEIAIAFEKTKIKNKTS